jgi:putative protease
MCLIWLNSCWESTYEVVEQMGSEGSSFKIEGPIPGERREKMEEQKIGEVIKFFGKIGVAAIRLTEGSLKVGEKIRIVGHTSDVSQVIESMQVDNASVQEAGKGADIGIKVKERVREHDAVYKVIG